MDNMLDIFKGDAFSVISLTDSINNMPFVPGRVGQIIDWNERGVNTLSIALESVDAVLTLVNPSARGGQGESIAKQKRTLRTLSIPHYEVPDAIYADEVQGVRAFGVVDQLQTVKGLVDQRMQEHVSLRLDPTLEYQRLGAVKGIILNGDGSTLYNLFTEFGVSQHAVWAFDLANATPASGAIRTLCAQITREIANTLGGIPYKGIYALCGDAFYDALISSKETRETFLNQQEAAQLRGGSAFQTFVYGDIVFENYRGAVNGTPFIATDEVRIFPVGVPALFKTVYAPADYIETVNTIGLARYAKQFPMKNDKGIEMEVQMNALSYCTRPKVLQVGTRAS
jgi:hypothetical protein